MIWGLGVEWSNFAIGSGAGDIEVVVWHERVERRKLGKAVRIGQSVPVTWRVIKLVKWRLRHPVTRRRWRKACLVRIAERVRWIAGFMI